MTVYFAVRVKIKDREAYDRYSDAFMGVFSKFDGTMLAADFDPVVIDGEWEHDRFVLMSFPDEQSLRVWLTSAEYQEIAADRIAGATTNAIIAKGLDA